MKKRKKLIIKIIAFMALWATFAITDYYRATQNKKPIFAIKFDAYWDGGTTEYLGLGYKVIKYKQLAPYDPKCLEEYREKFGTIDYMKTVAEGGCRNEGRQDTVFGFWTLKYENNY